MAWKTKGMNRDLSVSAFNPEFAYENMNLRLATNEGNTMMSWVNEKGTSPITFIAGKWNEDDETETLALEGITGTPIGTAIINHQLVIFTTGTEDCIYVLKFNEDKTGLLGKLLYHGHLNFKTEYPLETLVSYEAEDIQKVYWTDGNKQPRMINIANLKEYNDTSFDFVQDLKLEETITVKKECGNGGSFPSGVIQYAFTYYQKYGQESNIFYTTPLLYVSPADRGGRPDETVDNTFTINISHADENFDYLRIYSIQRTSVNGTPIVKRVQDISIAEMERVTDDNPPTAQSIYYRKTSYTDTGVNGNTVDPTELLYKGGESVIAGTIEQKDGTLFLGNLKIDRNSDMQDLSGGVTVNGENNTRVIYPNKVTTDNYAYSSQLTAYDSNKNSVPCAGFKNSDYYRCGVQYQYKTGKWSDPIFVGDVPVDAKPSADDNTVTLPVIKGTVTATQADSLIKKDYKKVRAVVVYPNYLDRVVAYQGISNPTLGRHATDTASEMKSYQSSWFFRPHVERTIIDETAKTVTPASNYREPQEGEYIPYQFNGKKDSPDDIRSIEIQGHYNGGPANQEDNLFYLCKNFATFHSPDIEFDDANYHLSMLGVKFRKIGEASFSHTLSDIDIQTETPTIGDLGSGFIHKSFDSVGSYGIVAGPFYEDYIVDDYDASNPKIERWRREKSPVKWMVYPWQRNGSLNNDIERPANMGVRSAVLKKKIISNYRYADTAFGTPSSLYQFSLPPQLFASNEVEITKLGSKLYQGNIDTLLAPDKPDGLYFDFDGDDVEEDAVTTDFEKDVWWKTFYKGEGEDDQGIYKWNTDDEEWKYSNDPMGNLYNELAAGKYSVRMKYKSTPHLIMISSDSALTAASGTGSVLPILEIVRPGDSASSFYRIEMFGGTSEDAKKANVWVPCGEPVSLGDGSADVNFEYSWGDTYYQRWDCMKTYPFTNEDVNQIIEIGSFMLETHVNIDGRYDRNRGQLMNVSPQNFNLMNPVYSQLNNFFQYKILDADDYKRREYPNQITWTKTKEAGADVDLWTNITLASTLELDGDKGAISKLTRLNDSLLCFQDTGIAQVLYNERAQLSTADGVPVELANSGKVDGKRYISNTIGCSNKWSMTTTPLGIYFMDSHDKSIYLFNGQLENLSLKGGMNVWAKNNIKLTKDGWNPEDFGDFVTYYDKLNQEVLFINNESALAFSEKFGTFTSFYNYGHIPYFCNLDEYGIWGKPDGNATSLWKHHGGDYCNFFGTSYPYWMTLVGNPDPLLDKTFTNLEFRACVEGEGPNRENGSDGLFEFYLPFDSLEVWDEYQHGIAELQQKNGSGGMQHHMNDSMNDNPATAALKRKFRIWRCDIPRDNAPVPDDMGLPRVKARPLDRMRNPWVYLKLMKNVESEEVDGETIYHQLPKVEVHDMVMDYFV